MTTQSLAVKLISSVITFYLEVRLLRNTLLARTLFYSSKSEEEGVPRTTQQYFFSLLTPGHLPVRVPLLPRARAGEFLLERLSGESVSSWMWVALALDSRGSRKALSSPPVPGVQWRQGQRSLASMLQLRRREGCVLGREIFFRTWFLLGFLVCNGIFASLIVLWSEF